jgi:hypothetical protein
MRFPRMTMRGWMVAVAMAATALGVTMERRNRFRKVADYHQGEFSKLVRRLPGFMSAGSSEDPTMLRLEWHESMRRRYDRAARYPWLPVEPDPPEPK